jgi:hypothetical protein
LMEKSVTIELAHLNAALAVADYCERSAVYVFGNGLGDKDAERILDALRAAPEGMTRSEIRRGVFQDNKRADIVTAKLSLLLRMTLVRSESIPTAGRNAERWFAVFHVPDGVRENVKNVESPPPATPFHVNHVNHVPRNAESVPGDREVFEL